MERGMNHIAERQTIKFYLIIGSLGTEDGEFTTQFCTRLNRGQAIGASLEKT